MSKLVLKKNGNLYEGKYGYFYILPGVIVLAVLGLAPFIYDVVLSFTDKYLASTASLKFVGLKNYISVFSNRGFWIAVFNTMVYVFFTVSIEFILGFVMSLIFQFSFKGKKLLRSLILIPMVATPIAVSFMWRIIFHPTMGVLNYLLSFVGVNRILWLAHSNTAMLSVIMVDIWQWTPFVFIILCSGIAALPSQPFESCLVDGGSFFQAIRYVMLPLLRPIIYIVLIFRLVDSIKAFDTIFLLTGGGPGTATETLNIQTYLNAFKFFKMGYACSIAIIVLILIILLTNLMVKKADLNLN